MMYKIVDMGSWSGMDVEPLHVIKVANRGLGAHDRHELLQKRAASHVFAQLIDRGELRDGDIPIHMTALGATEFYGCFAAGTPVAMSDGRYLGIEHLSVGDAVLTADGNVGEVSYLFKRDVAASLAIDVCGLADLLRCSADHPFRVARREQFSCDHDKYKRCLPPTQGKQNICNRPIHFTRDCVTAAYRDVVTEWGTAESLREGDFLVWTCPQLTPPVTMCASEGYLLGSWLAEGSFIRNGSNKAVSAISLAIHSNETEFLIKLRACAASLGLTCRDYTYPDGNDPNSRSVVIAGNPEHFRLWHTMFNEHALHKRLPPWTCNLPRATRLAILAGYIDGDGSCAVGDKENRTTARSHGNELSLGLQRLAWSLGLPAVRCCVAPKDAAANPGWNLSIANSYLGELEAFSWKVCGRDLKQTTKVHSFYHRGRMFLPVRSVVAAGPLSVYNLEVDGDHTYSGPNVDSHNCNRNGDGFKEAWCERYHDGFVKSARYYRHHKNTDPKKSYGLVKLSHYNRPMRRVELLVIANGTKEAAARNGGLVLPDSSIQALMSGKPVEVSMSCVLDPQAPVLTHRGYVPIIDVKPGDKVLTHNGRWRTVTELRRRKYTGEVVTWRVQGIPYDVELTADHPMLAAKLATKAVAAVSKSAFNDWMKKSKHEQYEWMGAGLLEPSDRVQACVASEGIPGEAVIDNEELAEILGTYMAEGSVTYNGNKPAAVQFTINGADWAMHHLTGVAHHHWPELTATIAPKTNSPVAFTLTMSSTSLATYLAKTIGTNSHTKKVPLGLYGASGAVKSAFIGRWIDGDGWVDSGGAHISSVNLTALLSARDLVLSLGRECVIAQINHAETRENGYGASTEYVLSMCPATAQAFVDYSQKCSNAAKRWQRSLAGARGGCGVRYGARTIAWANDVASYRLRKVSRRYVENVQTYNFEVADDHSYSLLGLASHNCKIAHDVCNNCGHKAASRNDYCTEDTCVNPHTGYRGFGCRAGLTKTADDGYMQYVDNPNPHWFDISEVATHADRIAFGGLASYLKAAGVPACGGAELAEQLLPFELLSPFGTASFELEQQRVLSKLAAIEGKLRAATPSQADLAVLRGFKRAQCSSFDGLGEFGGRDFPRALAALSRRDTLLSPRDFVRWIEGGEIKTASALSQLHAAVPHSFTSLMFDASLERWLANNPYCPAETSLQRFDKAAATAATAFTPENIKTAAIMSPLYDETPAAWNVGSRDVPENAAALAQQYALYKLAYVTERRDRDDFEELCRLAVLQNFAM